MEELWRIFSATMLKVNREMDDLKMFDQLTQNILDNQNKRDNLQLAIDPGKEFTAKSSMDTKDSLITLKRNITERLGFGKTVEEWNDILKKELQDNAFCVIPNFLESLFVGKELIDQAFRI